MIKSRCSGGLNRAQNPRKQAKSNEAAIKFFIFGSPEPGIELKARRAIMKKKIGF